MNIFSPLQIFADWVAYDILSSSPGSREAEVVNFFVYDTLKIFILLFAIIFVVSILRSFFSREKIRRILSYKNTLKGNIIASFLGIITPFCTCSAIPLFLGFIEAGVPLGVTFSFLVASPMINEVVLIMLLGMFGWKVALIYIVSGLLIAILSGVIIGKMKVENLLTEIVHEKLNSSKEDSSHMTWKERLAYAFSYVVGIIQKVWLYVVIGIGIGAYIHGAIPTDFLAQYAGADRWYAVPLAVLVGIPLYSNAAGVIPLVSALTEKGVAIGTTLAFMMAVTGLSLPEFMILRRIMKTKLILIFAGIVGVGIIITGYVFNWLLG